MQSPHRKRKRKPEDQIFYESPIEGEYWEIEEFLHEGNPAWKVSHVPDGFSDVLNSVAFQPVFWDNMEDMAMHLDRHNEVISHHIGAADKPKWSTDPLQHKRR
tara:strand:- start:3919 stop:4227 length:309 start_codon:yes stop_codon:yes gene_type:complete